MKLKQVLIALDQLANTLAGGWADETWSARCWREERVRWVGWLEILGRDHCRTSYESELYRRQLPPAYRPDRKKGSP